MRLFHGNAVKKDSELPWLTCWRDSHDRLMVEFPFRVLNTIDEACNGQSLCRAGILLGSVQESAAGKRIIRILHAFPLEFDKNGQLGSGARDRLTACCPGPGKSAITAGLFVQEAAGEPEAICTLLLQYKPLLPPSMVILVVSHDGVARFHEWTTQENKLVALSPELGLSSALSMAPGVPLPVDEALQEQTPIRLPPDCPYDVKSAPAASGVIVHFEIPRWVWGPILLLTACMLVAWVWYLRGNRIPQPKAQLHVNVEPPGRKRLDLQVSRRGSDLLINWDRNLQTNIGAQHGVLEIMDGSKPTYLALSTKDLASGQVLYIPHSQNVEIQLTAFTRTDSVYEAIRVIQAGTAPPYTSVIDTPRPVAPHSRQTAETPNPKPKMGVDTARTTAPVQPLSQMELPEVPAVASSAIQPPFASLPVSTTPTAHPQPSSIPIPSMKELVAAGTATLHAQAFQPPVVLRQMTPMLPPGAAKMLIRDTPISVKLRIDANGTIISAEAQAGSGVTGFLAKAAEETARSWRFRPATLGGKPVPAEYSLTFMFKR